VLVEIDTPIGPTKKSQGGIITLRCTSMDSLNTKKLLERENGGKTRGIEGMRLPELKRIGGVSRDENLPWGR